MPFLDYTLLFQRGAIQCSSVTKLYCSVSKLVDAIPFLRCGLPITSVPSPGYSMLFRSGVVQFQVISKLFLRLSELFPVQTTRRNSSARLIYPMPLLGKAKQFSAALFTSVASRLTTYLRCSVSVPVNAILFHHIAFRGWPIPLLRCDARLSYAMP